MSLENFHNVLPRGSFVLAEEGESRGKLDRVGEHHPWFTGADKTPGARESTLASFFSPYRTRILPAFNLIEPMFR